MKILESEKILKAMGDKSRLAILNSLREKPQYVEELATRLDLAPSTISFHLKKMTDAGLLHFHKEQYYVMYELNSGVFDRPVRDFISFENTAQEEQENRLAEYRRKVLKNFFRDGMLQQMPAQYKKKLIVIEEFAKLFKADRKYSEQEVNELVRTMYDDHCLIRRMLVDHKYLSRQRNVYQILESQRTSDPKTAYKNRSISAGIFTIRNPKADRVFLGSSLDLNGPLERHRMELETGSHRCRDMQNDFNNDSEFFLFDIMESFSYTAEKTERAEVRLQKLENTWIQRLEPFGENGYNTSKKIRY